MPYLNRAIAEEQLGVDAAAQHDPQLAQQQFAGAVQVSTQSVTVCYHGKALVLTRLGHEMGSVSVNFAAPLAS